jgi:hypothetical protein
MGRGGWHNRNSEASGYEPGQVYYQLVNHPDAGDPDSPRWFIKAVKVIRETHHYLDLEVMPGRRGPFRQLKPWVAHPSPEAAIEAERDRIAKQMRHARRMADNLAIDLTDLEAFAANPETARITK